MEKITKTKFVKFFVYKNFLLFNGLISNSENKKIINRLITIRNKNEILIKTEKDFAIIEEKIIEALKSVK